MANEFYKIGVQLALKKISAALLSPTDKPGLRELAIGAGALAVPYVGAKLPSSMFSGGVHLEKRLAPAGQFEKLVETLPKVMKLPADVEILRSPSVGYGFYSPTSRSIFVPYDPSPSILAHEIGHALGKSKRPVLAAQLRSILHLGGRRLAIPAAISQLFIDPDATLGKVIAAVPAVLSAPRLLEEARASAIALRGLYHAGGRGAMLRGLLPLVPAFGTYAIPAAVPFITRGIIKHFKE